MECEEGAAQRVGLGSGGHQGSTVKAGSSEGMVHLERLHNSKAERINTLSPVEGPEERCKCREVLMLVVREVSRYCNLDYVFIN